MKRLTIVIGYLLLSGFCISQNCLKSYEYTGKPKSIIVDSISTMIGSTLFFDFVTYDVPDKLTIYTCSDSFSFYTGVANDQPGWNFIKGFGLIELSDESWYLKYQGSSIPPNFNGSIHSNGMLRIIYRSNCCKLKWKIEGNKNDYTVFTVCIQLANVSTIPIDTIQIPHCDTYSTELKYDSCGYVLHEYIDSTIQIEPVIIPPSCVGNSDGSIRFPKFPQFNLYDVAAGVYTIEVKNTVCSRIYKIQVATAYSCFIFIPNVFSPNEDGQNDFFFVSSDIDEDYELSIFDRWGNLLHFGKYKTNSGGWTDLNVPIGVYAYLITMSNSRRFTGDVTIVR